MKEIIKKTTAGKTTFLAEKRLPRFLIVLGIVLMGLAIYANSLQNEFLFDDIQHVVENTAIRSFANIPAIFTHSLAYFGGVKESKFYRPIEELTFMFDYFLWGNSPIGYHVTNTILHILVALLLLRVIFRITGNSILSFITTLLYLVHPVHTEAVTYVSGRADSVVTIFLLLMLILQFRYWHSEKNKIIYYILMLKVFFLALITKELAVVFPFLLIFSEYCLRDRERYTSLANKNAFFYLPFFILAIVWFLIKNMIVSTETMVEMQLSLNTRLTALPRLIYDYVRLSFLPLNLHMEYKLPFAKSLFQPGYFGPFIFALFFASILYYVWKRSKRDINYRIIFFGLGWFFIALLPYLNILFQLNAAFAEHWLYIPEIGFILSVTYFIFYYAQGKKWLQGILLPMFAIVIIVFSYLTIRQNTTWKDGFTFYSYTIKYAPYSDKFHNNLAVEYIKRKDLVKAKELFEKAIAINPKYDTAIENLRHLEIEMKRKGIEK